MAVHVAVYGGGRYHLPGQMLFLLLLPPGISAVVHLAGPSRWSWAAWWRVRPDNREGSAATG